MKNKWFQRVICFILSATMLLGALGITASAASLKADPTGTEKNPYTAATLEEMQSLVGTLSYADYIKNYGSLTQNELVNIEIDVTQMVDGSNGVLVADSELCQDSMLQNPNEWLTYGDNQNNSVYLPNSGSTTWQFEIDEQYEGLYYIRFEYYSATTDESSISGIERKFFIDGKIPFNEVATLRLNKDWQYKNIETETTDAPGVADSYDIDYIYEKGGDSYKKVVTKVKDGKQTVTTYTLSQDINGNSMTPETSSAASWNTYIIQDSTGYYSGYFAFYLAYGSHTITLEAEREPVIIKSIELIPATGDDTEVPTYEEVLAEYAANGYGPATNGASIRIEAEFPDLVSDASVSAANDKTNAANTPINSAAQVFNVIGKTGYGSVGQWAAYKFSVTEDGLYNLGMRFQQSALQGMFACRTIKLSGGQYGLADGTPTVPFQEAYNARFDYSKDWQSTFISDGESDPFLFYFEEGVEYTLYLECSLGTLRSYIERVETSLNNVNECYLSILKLTGPDPDEYNDMYDFVAIMPEVLWTLCDEAENLMEVKDELEKICGTNGSHIATLETVAILLDKMGSDEGDEIAANLSNLKSYLGTLGTWINSSKNGTIIVDSIWFVPAVEENGKYVCDEDELPEAEAGFFKSIWFEIKSFFYSFIVEYDQMGLTTEPDEDTPTIDVWQATGRDQSQIWRTMIDAKGSYTDSTGTAVALKLVTGGTLLPSILSGKGPDVYIGLDSASVINYAIRNAIIGVSGNATKNLTAEQNAIFTTTYYTYKFEDADGNVTYETTTEYRPEDAEYISNISYPFEQVVYGDGTEGDQNFADAAMDTVTLLDVTYGIPHTMGFAMMFYRMDVLAELGQEVPESWGELLSILPVLQSNNMAIGVSYISALDFMIYQEGGSMWKYTDESLYSSEYAGARIDLDSNIALAAFEFTCSLYSDFSFPVSYDAANRFRTGEMPIIIGDYATVYNSIVVYATEIEGLWEFCSLPGSTREDGTFNYDSLAGIGATVILHGCDNLLAAWQFTQWQTGAWAQAEYGNRIVALIGPAAKYESANLKAMEDISWSSSEKAAIKNQMEHLSSIVNYPGSYIINRYMQFAFLDAVNNGADAVDALSGYIDAINSEIWRKRSEFDLWIPEDATAEPPQLETAPIE